MTGTKLAGTNHWDYAEQDTVADKDLSKEELLAKLRAKDIQIEDLERERDFLLEKYRRVPYTFNHYGEQVTLK